MSNYLPLAALLLFMLASIVVGVLANRAMEGKSFLKAYFLGNRGLGPWAMALTATIQSGGTFMGFPSLVYTHGWVVALWIASYMVIPLTSFGVMGKRIGQLARRTGSITLPDLLYERFGSPAVGLAATWIIIIFMTVNMTGQFKAGALILKTVMAGKTQIALSENATGSVDNWYVLGLAVFTVVVVGYTVYGGFLAAVWTDVFQSVMMLAGVLILWPLTLMRAGGLEAGTHAAISHTSFEYAYGPGFGRAFLPLGAAVSYFCLWALAGMGQPSTLVRHMAFRDTKTIRHATLMLAVYNFFIYVPILMIFVCARGILPELAEMNRSDEIMPRLAVEVAHPVIAGLILTAPFGAVMATVSAFLVVIASGVVRDVYVRRINPSASEKEMQRATYQTMIVVSALVAIACLRPPEFLQEIIVYAGGSLAAAFLVPALMLCFWPRATVGGTLSAMIGGPLTMLVLYAYNIIGPAQTFKEYLLFGIHPFVWGVLVSGTLGVGVSLVTPPPEAERVRYCFQESHTVPQINPDSD